jgi:predicted RNase H-like nuclease
MAGPQTVAGVDGCRSGWVVATVSAHGRVNRGGGPAIQVAPRLDEVVAAIEDGRLYSAAVDIPIGLATAEPRVCDLEARRMLGPRRASVFPAPVRAVLGTTSYAEACAVSRSVCGKALSKQLYNIVGKIREVDELLSPTLEQRLFEACPELSFALMSGGEPMRHSKRIAAGRAERVAALQTVFGDSDVESLVGAPPKGASSDDVLDALALAWTARRHAAGSSVRLGGDVDETGLRMEVIA